MLACLFSYFCLCQTLWLTSGPEHPFNHWAWCHEIEQREIASQENTTGSESTAFCLFSFKCFIFSNQYCYTKVVHSHAPPITIWTFKFPSCLLFSYLLEWQQNAGLVGWQSVITVMFEVSENWREKYNPLAFNRNSSSGFCGVGRQCF